MAEEPDEHSAVEVKVLALTGDTIAVLTVNTDESICSIKQQILELRPAAAIFWQHLLLEDKELHDTNVVGDLLGADKTPLTIHLIVSVSTRDLFACERAQQAANSLAAMGSGADPHVRTLFEADAGEPMGAKDVESIFNSLSQLIGGTKEVFNFQIALVPHAMQMMASSTDVLQTRRLMARIFGWFGSLIVPHVVAWLGLLERPVAKHLHRRLDILYNTSEEPRIRLAVKTALKNKERDIGRVEELSALRMSLHRDILQLDASTAEWVRLSLEEARAAATAKLGALKDQKALPKLRYAAERALKLE